MEFNNINTIFGVYGINSFTLSDNNSNSYIRTNSINTQLNVVNSDFNGNNNNKLLEYYTLLSKISMTLNDLLLLYSKGLFEDLNNQFTIDIYTQLANKLNGIKYPNNNDYEILRNSLLLSLEGLWQCMIQFSKNKVLNLSIIQLTKENTIMKDPNKLIEYIKQITNQTNIFSDVKMNLIEVKLKPEYAIYISMYGYPEGGVFDATKLAGITTPRYNIYNAKYGLPVDGIYNRTLLDEIYTQYN
jgi:hypothetical protein